MRLSIYCVVVAILFSSLQLSAQQKKIVIMGSSTAAGYGASVYDSAWGGRLTHYYSQNTSDGLDTAVINIALPGLNSYYEMPDNSVPAIAGRPLPDPNHNVTKALSYNPDIVILNLPSNDVYAGYSKKEQMDNFRTIYYTVVNAGKKCFITTSQPRDDIGMDKRDSLLTLCDSVYANFGYYAINFWTDVVTTDGTLGIKPEMSAGDAIHINPLGHYNFYLRVLQKQMFTEAAPLPLRLMDFKAILQNNQVAVQWQVLNEDPHTIYEIQRSADGSHFETIHQVTGIAPGRGASYSWIDQHPLDGKSFYRLKFNEGSRAQYSKVVFVSNTQGEINISKLYKSNASTLIAEIHSRKNQQLNISVISMTGELVLRQSQNITLSSNIIRLNIDKLASGQYYLRIDIPSGEFALKAFNK